MNPPVQWGVGMRAHIEELKYLVVVVKGEHKVNIVKHLKIL